jgi:hypothetical protein
MGARHANFHEVVAGTNRDLGRCLGALFRNDVSSAVDRFLATPARPGLAERARACREATRRHLPEYLEELGGFAEGAGVDLDALWAFAVEEEVSAIDRQRCTNIVLDRGRLIGHNEDYSVGRDIVCILKKSVAGRTTIELYDFLCPLGGMVGMRSDGVVFTGNTLHTRTTTVGVPRNVLIRWWSESSDVERDFSRFSPMPKGLAYNVNLSHRSGMTWNIEFSSSGASLSRRVPPFVHTNHFLDHGLRRDEDEGSVGTSRQRFDQCAARVGAAIDEARLVDLLRDRSGCVFNDWTVAQFVFDLERS